MRNPSQHWQLMTPTDSDYVRWMLFWQDADGYAMNSGLGITHPLQKPELHAKMVQIEHDVIRQGGTIYDPWKPPLSLKYRDPPPEAEFDEADA